MENNLLKNLTVHTVPTKEEACAKLTEALNSTLKKFHEDTKPFLLLVSGGSAFDLFPYVDLAGFSGLTTLGVLDERYSTDPKENNFTQFLQTDFYHAVKDKGAQFIDTTAQNGEAHEAHAQRFEQALSDWKATNPDGVIIATVGIGPDGHTSGVLPFPENPSLFTKLFENPDKLVAAYDADGKNPYRYRSTTTNTFLRDYIDYAFVYAVGANKKEALTRLVAQTGDLPTTPARVLREMKDVALFTDVTLE
jgi:6-phosphogluconolactonase/glucosamine-6-phosphate isomerase/deaminase